MEWAHIIMPKWIKVPLYRRFIIVSDRRLMFTDSCFFSCLVFPHITYAEGTLKEMYCGFSNSTSGIWFFTWVGASELRTRLWHVKLPSGMEEGKCVWKYWSWQNNPQGFSIHANQLSQLPAACILCLLHFAWFWPLDWMACFRCYVLLCFSNV